MSFCWDRFLKEGEDLFNYMKHNFETMFDGDTIIKHFYIGSIFFGYDSNAREINKKYGEEIQKEIIPWIKKELEEGRLFDNTNWKPFRDSAILTDMYLGYKKIFKYNNYYFQFALEDGYTNFSGCGADTCKYCNEEGNTEMVGYFLLKLYGWFEEDCEDMQPRSCFKVLENDTIPESFWELT